MRSFVQKLKATGCEKVELIDTTDGMFMSHGEAGWMALSGSALLVRRKKIIRFWGNGKSASEETLHG